jgi:hypothetical protein
LERKPICMHIGMCVLTLKHTYARTHTHTSVLFKQKSVAISKHVSCDEIQITPFHSQSTARATERADGAALLNRRVV